MLPFLFRDPDEPASTAPHFSHSRVQRYLLCPEQYRLYYVENLRPKVPPAALVFGQIIHQAMAELLQKKGDPVKHFQNSWGMLKGVPLGFNHRDSWEKLNVSGQALLGKFVAEELPKLGAVKAVEQPFSLSITNLDVPFIGIIDLVTEMSGKRTIVDWKTAGSAYDDHEALLSDQLTAYKLAEPGTEQFALCVLVKTKDPQIEWHVVGRTGEQMTEYLAKVGYVVREIAQGRFYKRTGMWCAWCDFLPICTGNPRKAQETLVTVP